MEYMPKRLIDYLKSLELNEVRYELNKIYNKFPGGNTDATCNIMLKLIQLKHLCNENHLMFQFDYTCKPGEVCLWCCTGMWETIEKELQSKGVFV